MTKCNIVAERLNRYHTGHNISWTSAIGFKILKDHTVAIIHSQLFYDWLENLSRILIKDGG